MHKKTLSKKKKTRKGTLTKRKVRKSKSMKSNKQSRKRKGGTRYGSGIGSNCYDPNYSIYNTNLLKLFPYKA